jgi:23S rRNA (pseudouridine1915-N3)-methyltransferase
MKIRIYAIGKIKDVYLKMGIEEYLKKIKPYTDIEIIEVKDESISENPHDSEIKKAIDIEGSRIIKLLKNNEYLIGLDLNKKE